MVEVDLPYLPKFRGARYPKGLQTDFRRLQYRALAIYVKRHSLRVRPDATQSELAVVVASHFHAMKVSMNDEWSCGGAVLLLLFGGVLVVVLFTWQRWLLAPPIGITAVYVFNAHVIYSRAVVEGKITITVLLDKRCFIIMGEYAIVVAVHSNWSH